MLKKDSKSDKKSENWLMQNLSNPVTKSERKTVDHLQTFKPWKLLMMKSELINKTSPKLNKNWGEKPKNCLLMTFCFYFYFCYNPWFFCSSWQLIHQILWGNVAILFLTFLSNLRCNLSFCQITHLHLNSLSFLIMLQFFVIF